jgi:hypothetical protein
MIEKKKKQRSKERETKGNFKRDNKKEGMQSKEKI